VRAGPKRAQGFVEVEAAVAPAFADVVRVAFLLPALEPVVGEPASFRAVVMCVTSCAMK
jgi:hypothetical protein